MAWAGSSSSPSGWVIEISLTDEEKANLGVSVDAVKELLEACKALDSSLA